MTAPEPWPPESATPDDRPTVVSVATWLLLLGAAMLIAGGLETAAVGFDTLRRVAPSSVSDASVRSYLTLYRGTGALFAVSGAGLAFLAMRTRGRDARYRRALLGLALAIVVLAGGAAVFSGAHILALLSLLPIIIGVLLLNRHDAIEWFAAPYPYQFPRKSGYES
jgi:hypothetical protein